MTLNYHYEEKHAISLYRDSNPTHRQTDTYTHTNRLLVKEELANIHTDRQPHTHTHTHTHAHTHIQNVHLPRLIVGFSLY